MDGEALKFEGQFFDGRDSRPHRVSVTASSYGVRLIFLDNPEAHSERTYGGDSIVIGTRIGDTSRFLTFDDGAKVESLANEAIDRLTLLWGQRRPLVHRLESSWRVVVAALLLIVGGAWVGFVWGVPWAAKRVAMSLPAEMASDLGKGTLVALDKLVFSPSGLDEGRKEELRVRFRRMAAGYPELPLNLNFRKMGLPNAFALPDGSVVVTDELVEIADGDEEVMGVLAHEIGHVKHRHVLRMTLESSVVGLFTMLTFGDASHASALFASLPAIYANARHSREKEAEADGFAIMFMQSMKMNPAVLGDILERVSSKMGEDKSFVPAYFASHPATKDRVARLRATASPTIDPSTVVP